MTPETCFTCDAVWLITDDAMTDLTCENGHRWVRPLNGSGWVRQEDRPVSDPDLREITAEGDRTNRLLAESETEDLYRISLTLRGGPAFIPNALAVLRAEELPRYGSKREVFLRLIGALEEAARVQETAPPPNGPDPSGEEEPNPAPEEGSVAPDGPVEAPAPDLPPLGDVTAGALIALRRSSDVGEIGAAREEFALLCARAGFPDSLRRSLWSYCLEQAGIT